MLTAEDARQIVDATIQPFIDLKRPDNHPEVSRAVMYRDGLVDGLAVAFGIFKRSSTGPAAELADVLQVSVWAAKLEQNPDAFIEDIARLDDQAATTWITEYSNRMAVAYAQSQQGYVQP